jgi:hypothetical protein
MPRDWLTGENMGPEGSREPWLAAFYFQAKAWQTPSAIDNMKREERKGDKI